MDVVSSELEAKTQKIMDALESAGSVEEKLSAIKAMEEANVDETAVGIAYFWVGHELFKQGEEDLEKVTTYLLKSLNILQGCGSTNLAVILASNLYLLGCACGGLRRLRESLGYLERAEAVLREFEEQGEGNEEDKGEAERQMLAVQRALVAVKSRLAREEDAIDAAKKQQQLMDACKSAETVDKMLSAIKDMEEANVAKEAIGISYFRLGFKLYIKEDHKKVVTFLLKALNILQVCDRTRISMVLAVTLRLLGCACGALDRWSESLGYLERAEDVLSKVEEQGTEEEEGDVKHHMLEVQRALVKVKLHLFREEDAIENIRKCVEIQGAVLGEESREVGDDNHDLAKACVESLRFKEALPVCLKALKVHELHLGSSSVEVARDRLMLGVIYIGLGEKEKAGEQNQLLREVLQEHGLSSDLLKVLTDAADLYIKIGKGYEAVENLKGVVSLTDSDSMDRAKIFISMARALGNPEKFTSKALGDQEKLARTRKSYLEKSCRILAKKEGSSPLEVCRSYEEISMVYQDMEDFHNAMSLTKKSLVLLEKLPEEKQYLGIVTGRMGCLLRLAGEIELSISCYEDAVEILKETFGEMNFEVARVYCTVGCAYSDLGRPESAAQYYSMAQKIFDATLGPNHILSIKNCESLSVAYADIENYELAVKFMEKVVEGWKSHGPSGKLEYQDRQYILEQLIKKSRVKKAASLS